MAEFATSIDEIMPGPGQMMQDEMMGPPSMPQMGNKKTSRKSLRLLGTVGEPINPEAWEWYYRAIGNSSCPIMDTWWQTETGGHLITPLPYAIPQKAGSATLPFFGIKPALVDDANQELGDDKENKNTKNTTVSYAPSIE